MCLGVRPSDSSCTWESSSCLMPGVPPSFYRMAFLLNAFYLNQEASKSSVRVMLLGQLLRYFWNLVSLFNLCPFLSILRWKLVKALQCLGGLGCFLATRGFYGIWYLLLSGSAGPQSLCFWRRSYASAVLYVMSSRKYPWSGRLGWKIPSEERL